jgi:aminoglycoside/choline kinase family phosphotransferase
MWGNLLVGAVAAVAVVVAARMMSPIDYHLNKPYLQRVLRRQGVLTATDRVQKLRVQRMPVAATEDLNLERVFQRVELQLAGGQVRYLVAQSFYPLAILFEQREREKKSMAASLMEFNPYQLRPTMITESGLQSVKEDPMKNEAEEARVKLQKIERLNEEVGQLRRLNEVTDLYPRLINFDPKALLTLTADVGGQRLDDALLQLTADERFRLLEGLVRQIARAHQAALPVVEYLLPGMQYTESILHNLLEFSISLWPKAGVSVTEGELYELQQLMAPVVSQLVATERGLKLGEATPRSFYYDGSKCQKLDWGMARHDLSCFDVAELVCDPTAGLSLEQEAALAECYQRERQLPDDVQRDIAYASIVYRLILSGYICQYIAHYDEMTPEQREQLGGLGWTRENLYGLWSRLAEQTGRFPELTDLSAWYEQVKLPVQAL